MNADIFQRPERETQRIAPPRAKTTRRKPEKNQWVAHDSLGMVRHCSFAFFVVPPVTIRLAKDPHTTVTATHLLTHLSTSSTLTEYMGLSVTPPLPLIFFKSADERTDPRDERSLVLCAVGRDPNLYRYASAELRKDRAWVLDVIRQDWRALEHTSEVLKGDREIVLSAVNQVSSS